MPWSTCISVLDRWLLDLVRHGIEPPRLSRLQERYLHHWFTATVQAARGTGQERSQEQRDWIHPEWPTWKQDVQTGRRAEFGEGPVYYHLGEDRNYLDPEGVQGHSQHGAIDVALGDYHEPEVLVEFKWDNQYRNWGHDFLKLMDPRLLARNRVFFGVRLIDSERHKGGDKAIDTELDKVLGLVQAKMKEGGLTVLPFRALLVDVTLTRGRLGHLRYRLFAKGSPLEALEPGRTVRWCLQTGDSFLSHLAGP